MGLLTLAPEVPKDRLMQAASRLRQLGEGQTLLVMGLPDVTRKVVAAYASATPASAASSASGSGRQLRLPFTPKKNKPKGSQQPAVVQPDMRAVLTWVVSNTVLATLGGIGEAASQGMQFAATYGAPLRHVCCLRGSRLGTCMAAAG